MLIGITAICCSLLYSIMISIIYFSKKKIQNTENRIYRFMMIINIIGLLLELGCCYFLYHMYDSTFYSMMNVLIKIERVLQIAKLLLLLLFLRSSQFECLRLF